MKAERIAKMILTISLLSNVGSSWAACSNELKSYAQSVFKTLESTRDQGYLEKYYEAEFTSEFKGRYPFNEVYGGLISIHSRLGIGTFGGKDIEQRALSLPQITGVMDSNVAPQKKIDVETESIPFHRQHGKLVGLEFFTSSKVGKIRQRIALVCVGNEWKVQGFWYEPLGWNNIG